MSESRDELSVSHFPAFFEGLHGHQPFRWQTLLMEQVAAEGWPDLIDLPTASGKTACLDVAVFLLALQAPATAPHRTAARRIWFVVNRRIVVDEAYERAQDIAQKLLEAPRDTIPFQVAERLRKVGRTGLPLAVARLRGAVPKSVAWSMHPAQPAIITSTVDQVGSRLLFRGYGVGRSAWPVHAALAGVDSLIILDEAHTARAFAQTAEAIGNLRDRAQSRVSAPFHVVTMSATPPQTRRPPTVFPEPDRRADALKGEVLQCRFSAAKPAQLVRVGKATAAADPLVGEVARRAIELAARHRRIGIMVNRVGTAQAIYDALRQAAAEPPSMEVHLLTGRMRPIDRDRLVAMLTPTLRSGSTESPQTPLVLVTTQCLEVGADFSFETMICECASLDALRQRFGRLNRLGLMHEPAPAVIIVRDGQLKDPERLDDAKPLDPVYGNALARTWHWLQAAADTPERGSGKNREPAVIDMGVNALDAKLPRDVRELEPLLAPAPSAPMLLPAYLDLWSQTGPAPAVEPDVSLFLHGPQEGQPEAAIVFRDDLREMQPRHWQETIQLLPPMPGETLPVPLGRLRQWLGGQVKARDDSTDMEWEPSEAASEAPPIRRSFVIYRGRSDVEVVDDPSRVRPGDTVIIPSPERFPTELGTAGPPPVSLDVHDGARRSARSEDVVRVRAGIRDRRTGEPYSEEILAAAGLNGEEPDFDRLLSLVDLRGATRRIPYPDGAGWILLRKARSEILELDPFELDEAELLVGEDAKKSDALSLASHCKRVACWARRFAECCTDDAATSAIIRAAQLHDLGKLDSRFQRCLNDGRRFGAGEPLAKSRQVIPPARWRQLQRIAGLPEGFRHEMLSVQLAERLLDEKEDRDLILHLIASHHGHARPFAPVVLDEAPPDVHADGVTLAAAERSARPAHRLDSGVADRFWRLNRRYGWWRLAYLEALLRLADWQASRESEGGGHGD